MNENLQREDVGARDPAPPPSARTTSNSGRAAFCAVVPGLGAVYNGEYMKAVIHFSIFAGLWLIADEVGFVFALATLVFYLWTIIDAYRSAEALQRWGRRRSPEQLSREEGLNLPLWGGILVAMGVLFLLDNLGLISIRSVVQFWPVAFIFLGLYLILAYYGRVPGMEGPTGTPVRRAGPEGTDEGDAR